MSADGVFDRGYILKIVFLCSIWYTFSSSASIIVKTLLIDFPYPMTVTMVQLLSIWVYLQPVIRFWKIPPIALDTKAATWQYYFTMIFPLAFGKFVTSVSAHVSLWRTAVSYAHTVKATMPLFTIVLSRILLNERQTLPVYMSIVPIITGVCIATATELSFDMAGLVSALVATFGFSFLNIFTKKALKETGLHHLRMLLIISKITFVLFVPIWAFVDLRNILSDEKMMNSDKVFKSIVLLVIDAFANFTINVVAFTLLSLVTPLSYAVANATKRIVIISSSLLLLRNPVTAPNIFGMLLAVLGVLMYNKAKYDQAMERRRAILPYVHSSPNLQHNLHLSPLHRTNTDFDLQNHVNLLPTPAVEDNYKNVLSMNHHSR